MGFEMELHWNKLRPWNGDQRSAFEELCCQLAACEKVPHDSSFIRKGAPDAGLECFWILPDQSEWGWQAKYFTNVPNQIQWKEIDESVKTAIDKHPKLTNMTICLPLDRSDARIPNRKSFLDKWNDRVIKWQSYAKGRNISFNYWGDHEIIIRLSKEEHKGRWFFWFREESCGDDWFKQKVEENIANAGPRYTPEVNVRTDLTEIFDGLGRVEKYFVDFDRIYGDFLKKHKKIDSDILLNNLPEIYAKFQKIGESLLSKKKTIMQCEPIKLIGYTKILEQLNNLNVLCIEICDNYRLSAKETRDSQVAGQEKKSDIYEKEIRRIDELIEAIQELREYCENDKSILVNKPYLLLTGEAGTGKTHIFCDIAQQRVKSGLPSLLFLGTHFCMGEPLAQIVKHLGLTCTVDEFLGGLDAVGQAKNKKVIIFIDALNEGEGKLIWHSYLPGIIKKLGNYRWLALALSVRSSYYNIIIPDNSEEKLQEVNHCGFSKYELIATTTYFDYYNIQRPSIPLLIPEFNNPLFLKLFCTGLKNQGLTTIPSGLRGITSIFDFFIESIEKKLSHPDKLDYDLKNKPIKKSLEKLAAAMVERKSTYLTREDAKNIVEQELPRGAYTDSLFRNMVAEGLLNENINYVEKGDYVDIVEFNYERFSDYLLAKRLLEQLNKDDLQNSFIKSSLSDLLFDKKYMHINYRNKGLLEAISILMPEFFGKELYYLIPEFADNEDVMAAFIESLVWRDTKSFSDQTLDYINSNIIVYEGTHAQFLDSLVLVSAIPEHPYNANFLHNNLIRKKMPERDYWWSTFLYEQWGKHGAVDRIIAWAWADVDKAHIQDEAIYLCGKILTWFLSTSHRYVRDRATKALVRLFSVRIHLLTKLLLEFIGVDDLYILERLFAVCYGCVLRSNDLSSQKQLSQTIYDLVFKNGEVIAHILLRDYARGAIETSIRKGIVLDIEIEKIRPPYNSKWPSRIPSKTTIEKYKIRGDNSEDIRWAQYSIFNSVMNDDFARYILHTNWNSFNWLPEKINEMSIKEMCIQIYRAIPKDKRKLWKLLLDLSNHNDAKILDRSPITSIRRKTKLSRKTILIRESLKKEIVDVLPQDMQYLFIKVLSSLTKQKIDKFDISIIQRLILKKVFDLGWNIERFGSFDRNISLYGYRSAGRSAHKPERVGKKYQWLAYHDILARVADNFKYKGDGWSGKTKYEGTWQEYLRDIDPSCLLKETKSEVWSGQSNSWFFPQPIGSWRKIEEDETWLKEANDLPQPESLIDVANPNGMQSWLVLDAYYIWEEELGTEVSKDEVEYREIWYIVRSYIYNKNNNNIIRWANDQRWSERWMPEPHDQTRVFLGEFYDSLAFEYHNTPYWHNDGLTDEGGRIPGKVGLTTTTYLQESGGYDCSIDNNISLNIPSEFLVKKMSLFWNGVDGSYYNSEGELIAYDPSIFYNGPSVLLIKKEPFLNFLKSNHFGIFWTLIGEKQMLGDWYSDREPKGRLLINGTYSLKECKIQGKLRTEFEAPYKR
jgi:hypothetical protein